MSSKHALIADRFVCSHCSAIFRSGYARCPLCGASVQPLDGDPLVGKTLHNRYEIAECVGEGGMGRVYRAVHKYTGKEHALKVLFGDHAADPKMRARMEQEALAVGKLSHRNVIAVTDAAKTEDNSFYLVMDYVAGEDLAQIIAREAPFEPERVIDLVKQLCLGLGHAHEKGLVHRDFKSENVLITRDADGELAKIVDFGIAVVLEAAHSGHKLTSEGMVLGTPAFMSPEQSTGGKVDHRSDLFSLGVLMYEMLCGKLPFDGSPIEIARQNLVSEPPRISERVPDLEIDPRLEDIAFGLMAKRPEDRFQTADDVLRALDVLDTRSAVEREPSSPGRRARLPSAPGVRPTSQRPTTAAERVTELGYEAAPAVAAPGTLEGVPRLSTHVDSVDVPLHRRGGFLVAVVVAVALGFGGVFAAKAFNDEDEVAAKEERGGVVANAVTADDPPQAATASLADAAAPIEPAVAIGKEGEDVGKGEETAPASEGDDGGKAQDPSPSRKPARKPPRKPPRKPVQKPEPKVEVRPEPVSKPAPEPDPKASAQAEIEQYKKLYKEVGRVLDEAQLPAGHPLIRKYFDLNFQSGIMNANLRKEHIARLRRIRAELSKKN